jgi:hypothetical protein
MEAGCGIDIAFAFPIKGGGVAGDGGVDGQVWTLAATRDPAIAIKAMGAVAGEQPHVMEREEEMMGLTQGCDLAEIEIMAVEVVEVEDLFGIWNLDIGFWSMK